MRSLISFAITGFLGLIVLAVAIQVLQAIAMPVLVLLSTLGVVYLAYQCYLYIYFKSEKFIGIKRGIEKHALSCNELNDHIEDLKNRHSQIGSADFGGAELKDESIFRFKRSKWKENKRSRYTHNCSASVCKNASDQPFKYLCKYFNIKISEENLADFEGTLNDYAAVEEGKFLLESERTKVIESIEKDIPFLIKICSKNRLSCELGFNPVDLGDLYVPQYTFQYVSAGGNSSSKVDIRLDVENLENFIKYLSKLVKFRGSVAGQRALMTSRLRDFIKSRDNHTCKSCGASARNERNLLLEIDHIIPLSKGGATCEGNLQTLCWRCNRRKGSKIL